MGRAKQRADRIRAEVPMVEILAGYGYRVRTDAGDREQNFSCDLHGDGRDSRPSAIFYPRTNSAHCFACSRSRDAITWVQEKEGTDFWTAVKKIEADYNLPPLPWEDDPSEVGTAPTRPRGATSEVEAVFTHTESYDASEARVRRYLTALCAERSSPPAKVYALWEAYDKVHHIVSEGAVPERDAVGLMHRVLDKAKALAGGGSAEGSAG